jgi:hypothetical protein
MQILVVAELLGLEALGLLLQLLDHQFNMLEVEAVAQNTLANMVD